MLCGSVLPGPWKDFLYTGYVLVLPVGEQFGNNGQAHPGKTGYSYSIEKILGREKENGDFW